MVFQSERIKVDPQAEHSLRKLLEKLDKVLVPADHDRIREKFMKTIRWEYVDRPPLRLLFQGRLQTMDEKSSNMYPICEAVEDPAKMLINELWYGRASSMGWLEIRDDQPLQVRPNMGIGLCASTFGAKIGVVKNNPPWVEPLTKDISAIPDAICKALDEHDVEDAPNRGWIPRVSQFYEYFKQIISEYPTVEKCVAVIMPDLQGPFDTAAFLWGSDIFLALYTEEELTNRLLAAIAKTQVRLHDHLRQWVGRELLPKGYSQQHGLMISGNILIRCDSNLMISPEMFKKHIFPWDEYVVKNVGGGSFHSCGKWDHNVPAVLESEQFGTIDFGMNQSQYNDIETHYKAAVKYKKHFNQINTNEEDIVSGKVLKKFPTGATLVYSTNGIESAKCLMETYRKHTV
jgi:hypothetical protein